MFELAIGLFTLLSSIGLISAVLLFNICLEGHRLEKISRQYEKELGEFAVAIRKQLESL